MTTLFKSTQSPSGTHGSKVVKFSEIFPLEEVTHFDRKSTSSFSILNQGEVAGSSSSSQQEQKKQSALGFDCMAPRSIYSSNGSASGTEGKTVHFGVNKNPFVIDRGGESDSDSDDSNIQVFNRAENYDDSDILDSVPGDVQEKIKSSAGTSTTTRGIEQHCSISKFKSSESEENLVAEFPSFNNSFVLDVKRADVILDAIVFFVIVAELLLDLCLISWYYYDSQSWAAALSTLFFLTGTGSVLHQFNLLSQDQIKRLFDKGKGFRIVVNCFPPLATILSSFYCVKFGLKGRTEPMVSGQYLEVENFTKSIAKTQSFFQAAPQATLQLLLLIESIDTRTIGFLKGFVCMSSIIVSLTAMTNASLPSKADTHKHLRRTTQRPSSRVSVGIRMFSSFASRTMAVTSLLIGCRCIIGATITGTIIALLILLLPRIIFALVEFIRLVVIRRRRNVDAGSSTVPTVSCYGIFTGYMATILFPVGDPLWIFLYIWGESALFVITGNIIGWSKACLLDIANAIYTGTFLVLFIIIPILVPFARASIKQRQVRRIQNHDIPFSDVHVITSPS